MNHLLALPILLPVGGAALSTVVGRSRLAQRVIEIRELVVIRRDGLEVPDLQPLTGEIAHQRIRSLVGAAPT